MPSEQSTVLRTTGALDLVADIWREATGAVMGESRGILTLQTSDEAHILALQLFVSKRISLLNYVRAYAGWRSIPLPPIPPYSRITVDITKRGLSRIDSI